MSEEFNPGDQVRRRATGELGVVLAHQSGDFVEVAFPSGAHQVHVTDLEMRGGDPIERLAKGEVGRSAPYLLLLQGEFLKHAHKYDPAAGLSSARIEPQLHQVYVAHRVAQKLHPRMILADEVGLGKTIEAGLIISELRARGLAERVLIICPASLQMQWQHEMQSKFNDEFTIMDGAAMRQLGRKKNPWEAYNNVITSLPFASSPKRAEQIIEAEWDLVVFDEAHRVRRKIQGRKRETTQAYRMADDLKELVDGILLLTATPLQLQSYELYSLIELVEPGLFPTFEAYETRRTELPRLNHAMKALKEWPVLDDPARLLTLEQHGELLATLAAPAALDLALLDCDDERTRLMDALVQMHPLVNVLVRNRKAEVGGFAAREAKRIPITLQDEERQLYDDVTEYIQTGYDFARESKNLAIGFLMVTYQKMLASSSAAIRASLKKRIAVLRKRQQETTDRKLKKTRVSADEVRDAEEMSTAVDQLEDEVDDSWDLALEIGELEGLVERLGRSRDSKAHELMKALRALWEEHPDEKVVIFTQFMETQKYLAEVLETLGRGVALFNGAMNLAAKEEAVARFRHEQGVQVLLSTEAGGEGRNFQFAHVMVNYDLPWNPMKVEQRIGRLDRIGQSKNVFIYNLACVGTIEERILEVLENRIGLFVESVGSLDPILGDIEKDIEALVREQSRRMDDAFGGFDASLETKVKRAREVERTLADFVLDRASLRHDTAMELLGRRPMARYRDLEEAVGSILDYFGGTVVSHPDGGTVITLAQRLSASLRLSKTTFRGCFAPGEALQHEDLDFFAFGHQIVDQIVGLPLREPVETGVRALKGVSEPCVEFFYVIEAVGIHPCGQFLRHVVGPDLNVRSERVTEIPRGAQAEHDVVPSWAADAADASKKVFLEEMATEHAQVLDQHRIQQDEECERARRIFEYRRVRLATAIDEASEWIREAEASGEEAKRRVLPARKGKLARDEERLAHLEAEYEDEVGRIRAQAAGAAGRIVAAGIVVPA